MKMNRHERRRAAKIKEFEKGSGGSHLIVMHEDGCPSIEEGGGMPACTCSPETQFVSDDEYRLMVGREKRK